MPSMTAQLPIRPTLLLVDDCVAERELYQIVLGREFNILTANRGSTAAHGSPANVPISWRSTSICLE